MNRIFLTAEWRWLAMINYSIDPAILHPHVPAGTELDQHNGVTYVSVVGFRFLNTRLFGIGVPFHQNFDEVNLRFYVRRRVGGEWRRGVVFVRELVPRIAIAAIARTMYGEPYSALPMRHEIEAAETHVSAMFRWRRKGRWESMFVVATGESAAVAAGSEEEFITEHYWGYTDRRGRPSEYQVQHPRWRIWRSLDSGFYADVPTLYGSQFAECLSQRPVSAFIAEGSPVSVRWRSGIPTPLPG